MKRVPEVLAESGHPIAQAQGALARLHQTLDILDPLAIAVSGGVDSMTLAVVAHRRAPGRVRMFHAVSAAVPPDATRRVKAYAAAEGWDLAVIGAGELDDPNYLANPVDRCFFCKTNLYRTIAGMTHIVIASGANLDDLGDYRPGLGAAETYGVRHPYVEAGIGKAGIRAIAAGLRLADLAELPSSPCLASRIETGIAVNADLLTVIGAAEALVARRVPAETVRVRVRGDGVVLELDAAALAALPAAAEAQLARDIADSFMTAGLAYSVRVEPYRRGSAFLKDEAARLPA
jgi:uncharacterized protein